MNGLQLRDQAIQQQTDRNPLTIEQFLNEIAITRRCRLRRAETWDQVFTVEQLLKDIQTRCRLQAATNLYGAIGKLARARELISETGNWVSSERDSRHANKVPVCCWQP